MMQGFVRKLKQAKAARFRRDASGNVSLVGPDGIGHGFALQPSGYDQAAEIEQYINDTGVNRAAAVDLGFGEFIIGSPIQVHARKVPSIASGAWYGGDTISLGLRLTGVSPGETTIKYVGTDNTNAAILIAPTTANFGVQMFSHIGGFSFIRCETNGTPVAENATSGLGIACHKTATNSAVVTHTSKFERMQVSGFSYPFSLDDVTQLDMEFIHIIDFITGIRLGYNVDSCEINKAFFGWGSYSSFHNSAIGIQTGWVAPNPLASPGGGDNLILKHVLARQIGLLLHINGTSEKNIEMLGCYGERVRQYLKVTGASASGKITISRGNIEQVGSNGLNDYVGYPKIDFSDASASPNLMLEGLTVGGTTLESTIICGNNARIHWRDNAIPAPTNGHIASTLTGYVGARTIPNSGSTYDIVMGNLDVAGGTGGAVHGSPIAKNSGTNIVYKLATQAAGTLTLSKLVADQYDIASLTGNITVDIGLASPEGYGLGDRLVITVKQDATGSRTIGFSARFKPEAGNAASGTAYQKTRYEFEMIDVFNSHWKQVSPAAVWTG